MKLEHNITLGKILCVYIDQDPNIIYSYANYSMPFELMTLSVNYEPKLRNLFSVTPPFIRTLSHASAEQPIHSITHPFRNVHHTMKSCSPPPPQMYHQMPVNPALRIHVQGQPGLYEFEAIWPTQGQSISKIQKEISDKEFKS